MSSNLLRTPSQAGRLLATALLVGIGVFVPAVSQADPLTLFKNYFVTGDYTSAGVGLRGSGVLDTATQQILLNAGVANPPDHYATGTIKIGGVPDNADIVAAYLYWMAIESSSTPFTTDGTFQAPGRSAVHITGLKIGPEGINACWGSGGGNGTTTGASHLRMYRANVLWLIPFQIANGAPISKRLANGSFTVKLPDSGSAGTQSPSSSNQVNLTEGASLVIVYRLPSLPLKAVVIYDGAYSADQSQTPPGSMAQTIKGFYQASTSNDQLDAHMTQLVGDGDPNFSDTLTVNGAVPPGVSPTNAFQGAQGPAWDNLNFPITSQMMPVDSATGLRTNPLQVQVSRVQTSIDCLSWGAIIFSTTVQDRDFDGLLDIWETNGLTAVDNPANVLVDLPAMGANPDIQDVFVEIAYTYAPAGTTYGPAPYTDGINRDAVGHSHLPALATLHAIGDLFKSAGPRSNTPIDAFHCPGPTAGSVDPLHCPINIHFDVGANANTASYQGDPYVIPAALAKGGKSISEASVTASDFPLYPGTVGWKTGFRALRDGAFGFDQNRMHIFRFGLFAHALALQDTTKAAGTPRSTSGVGDAGNGGGDFMVTLGLWDNFTGTEFVQRSTTVHELVHTFGIRHGGSAPTAANPSPNCKPNYESIMSYLFQVRGLIGPNGPIVDLSRQVLANLDESNLTESVLKTANGGDMLYPTRWFAPLVPGTVNDALKTTPATRQCNGAPATVQMVRVDGTGATSPIDWNDSGAIGDLPAAPNNKQDTDFNGVAGDPAQDGVFTGFNDWLNLDLRQTATRRNRAGLSIEITTNDLPTGDPGFGDPGFGDPGFGDPGFGANLGDPGFGDPGFGDPGFGDPGFGDPGFGDPGFGGDLDFDRAVDLGNAPNNLHVVGTTNTAILVGWSAPNAGKATKYTVWRATGTISNTNLPKPLGTTNGSTLTFTDSTAKKKTLYTYIVTATVQGKNSSPSNYLLTSY